MRLIIFLCFYIIFAFSKILIVNSYDQKDQCGIPQLNGFLSQMYEHNFSPTDFDIYFLNARIASKNELIKRSKEILKHLNDYNYVVTFDDAAFQLIGIPAAKRGKIVFFSGINIPFKNYQKKYDLNPNRFAGVYEKLYVKEVLTTFNKIKHVNEIALFYSKGIGELVKNQIIEELKNTPFENKLILIKCKTIKDLRLKTKEANNNPLITLFMPLTLSLKHNNLKIPFYKIKNIYLKNIKKPDISINMHFVQMGFLGFGGVDFFAMGKETACILLDYLKHNKLRISDAPKAYYFINAKRAKNIKFKLPEWFIKDYVKDIVW